MAIIDQYEATRNLQKYLRQLSYTNQSIPNVPIDGIFDTATREALMAFQALYGIEQSGIADKKTWDMVYAEYLRSRQRYTPPRTLDVFPRIPDDYSLGKGDEYFLVSILQFLLNELNLIYDSFIPLVINGIFDDDTEANVMDFQKKNNISPTGRLDKSTWDRIIEAYDNYAKGYVR